MFQKKCYLHSKCGRALTEHNYNEVLTRFQPYSIHCDNNQLLTPASEGWGKVIVSVCPHLQGGVGAVRHPRSEQASTLSQVQMGGTHPRSGWGVPHPRSRRGILHPADWGGVPHPRSRRGYPIPGTCCYAAGSVPLAFMQEDFLVFTKSS